MFPERAALRVLPWASEVAFSQSRFQGTQSTRLSPTATRPSGHRAQPVNDSPSAGSAGDPAFIVAGGTRFILVSPRLHLFLNHLPLHAPSQSDPSFLVPLPPPPLLSPFWYSPHSPRSQVLIQPFNSSDRRADGSPALLRCLRHPPCPPWPLFQRWCSTTPWAPS